jgi:hypothetical protein
MGKTHSGKPGNHWQKPGNPDFPGKFSSVYQSFIFEYRNTPWFISSIKKYLGLEPGMA